MLCAKSLNAFHIASNEAYGFGSVAMEPGYKVAINVGNCSFTAIRTPDRANDQRAGAPMGRMTAFPTEISSRCLIMRQVPELLPHRIQRSLRLRVRGHGTRVQSNHQRGKRLVHRYPNHLQHHVYPRNQSALALRNW